jgi:hypothetical protein
MNQFLIFCKRALWMLGITFAVVIRTLLAMAGPIGSSTSNRGSRR